MAEKRMISSKITDHDNFTTLPATAQALYLHLVISADDDGFCAQTNSAMLKAHAKKKDLDELVKRKYLIRFPNGVCAIKHWKMQNTIRADRYHKTEYQEEKAQLFTKPNGAYTTTKPQPPGSHPGAETLPDAQPTCGQDDNQPATKPQPSDGQVGAETRQSASSGLGLGLGLGLVKATTGSNAHVREGEEAENDLARVMDFFLNRINPPPSPMAIERLKGFTENLGADVVLHALQIALDEHKTGWRYIQAILQRYERDGLRTMADVLKAEEEFNQRKETKRNGGTGTGAASESRGTSQSKWDLECNDLDGD